MKKFLLIFYSLLIAVTTIGQPNNGPPDPGGGGGRVPITESIVLLLSAGIGLGIKSFKKKNKN